MIFSEYLDSVEGTEQEKKLIEQLGVIKNEAAWTVRLPFLGKILSALVALSECESIEAFKQSEQFECVKDWNITVHDHESIGFSLTPSNEIKRKIAKVFAVVGAVMLLLWLYRKFCCGCKKKELDL